MAIEKKKTAAEADQNAAAPTISVQSNTGFKGEQKPRSFELEGKRLTILAVKKMWRQEADQGRHKTFFRVHAHDGRTYVLAYDSKTGEWTLEPHSTGTHG